MFFIFYFSLSLILSFIFTGLMRKLSLRWGIVDKPINERKIHKLAVPLLGGTGIFLAFFGTLFFARDYLLAGNLEYHHWLGVFSGAVFLMIGGFLDDKYNLKPSYQIFWPIIATVCVLLGGVEIQKITQPLNSGFIYLNKVFLFISWSDIFVFIWLLGMMYTTKLLDGLDGLVSGVVGIGGFIIALFTLTTRYYQPDIALAAIILTGSCLGFLIWNWNPAKIFLGEGGSLLLGFLLGVIAIISGGKVAIALLVMGFPILDFIWTIIRRLIRGQNPFKSADRQHLHHKLMDLGLSVRKTVLIFYFFSFLFGISALWFQSQGKLMALGILLIMMISLVLWLFRK